MHRCSSSGRASRLDELGFSQPLAQRNQDAILHTGRSPACSEYAIQLPNTGWPDARSSGGRGVARSVVPGGVSLRAVLVSIRSNVVTAAASIAIITATAKSTTAVRWLFHEGASTTPQKRYATRLVPASAWRLPRLPKHPLLSTSPSSSARAGTHGRASRPCARGSNQTDDNHRAHDPNHDRGHARP